MRSVADSLARDTQDAMLKLSAAERVILALRLGEQAIDTFAAANHVGRDEARRVLRRSNQFGRRRSVAASGDGG